MSSTYFPEEEIARKHLIRLQLPARLVPAKLIQPLNAGNPDRRENLQCICDTCHGYKLQADHNLCLGDKLAYMEILRTHHFDLARVERALAWYGL